MFIREVEKFASSAPSPAPFRKRRPPSFVSLCPVIVAVPFIVANAKRTYAGHGFPGRSSKPYKKLQGQTCISPVPRRSVRTPVSLWPNRCTWTTCACTVCERPSWRLTRWRRPTSRLKMSRKNQRVRLLFTEPVVSNSTAKRWRVDFEGPLRRP